MRRFFRRAAALMLAAAALAPAALRADPVAFAAASLKEALDAAAAAFVRERGGPRPVLSYAASPALARQIEQGAPADLFVSADRDWMDHLERGGHLRAGTRTTLAANRLVLVGPASGAAAVPPIEPGFALAAALGPGGRLAVGDVAAVPAGRYARAALESLGIWASVAGRLAQTENVRVALALVARGEAPLGIVYATDASAAQRVARVAAFPAASHARISYPFALVAGRDTPENRRLLDALQSPAALAVFARHGFAVD